MSEHTKGRLAYIDGRIDALEYRKLTGFTCKDGTEYMGGLVALPYPCGEGTADDNARRFVACWNALNGVPTEWLESFTLAGVDNVIQENAKLMQRRDELLEALKYAASALDTDGHDPIVDAAIAKATGEPK